MVTETFCPRVMDFADDVSVQPGAWDTVTGVTKVKVLVLVGLAASARVTFTLSSPVF